MQYSPIKGHIINPYAALARKYLRGTYFRM